MTISFCNISALGSFAGSTSADMSGAISVTANCANSGMLKPGSKRVTLRRRSIIRTGHETVIERGGLEATAVAVGTKRVSAIPAK